MVDVEACGGASVRIAFLLVGVLLMAAPAGAQAPDCESAAAECGAGLDQSCVERLGAGAVAVPEGADGDACDAQLSAYRACLGQVAARCGAAAPQRAAAPLGAAALQACAQVIAALRPFTEAAGEDGRARVASGGAEAMYSLPMFYYRASGGTLAFSLKHQPRLERWRDAAAGAEILLPEAFAEDLAAFDAIVTKEIEAGAFMSQDEMLAWLTALEARGEGFARRCRSLAG